MNHFYRIKLFLSIVWREGYAERIDIKTAWCISGIVWGE
jgi:hypothetical protein